MSDHSHDPTLIPPTITFLAPPQKTGDIGRLAQYRILKQLGRGGMGVVYQALDTNLNRVAALKVMHPEYAASEEARIRFKREAQAAAALKHDHIVTIYQVDEEQQVPFLAMEFLAGKSLEEWLRPDRQATVAETLLIGKQITRGLAAAHKAGLIHRDIKPANLWLEAPRGRVKILDFGLARHVTPDKSDLTQYGSVVGTPAYMAPEQARGEAVDHRCDLFSLGCVLYRMLAGRLPFQGDSTYAVLSAIATQTPQPLRELRADVPQRLSDLVARLLAKLAQERPKSAQAVFDELAAIERDAKQQSGPSLLDAKVTRRALPWPLWAGLGIAMLVVASLVVAWLASAKKEVVDQPEHQELNQPERPQVDLIARIEPIRNADTGNITKPSPGKLETESLSKGFNVVVPWTPPEEYDLQMKVTRQAKNPGQLRIGLSQGQHRFAMVIDHRHNDKSRSGLAYIDGKFIENRGEKPVGKVLRGDKPVAVVIEVRKDKVTLRADGALVYEWTGELSRLTRESLLSDEPLILSGNRESHLLFDELILVSRTDSSGVPYPEPPPKVDLIKLVDLQANTRGPWSVPAPGKLLGQSKERPFLLMLPWNPPREYRLRLKATRQFQQGRGELRIGLGQGDARFGLVIDHKEEKRIISGLHVIDNVSLEKRRDVHPGLVFIPGRLVDLAITVREQRFTVEANQTTIYDWSGDLGRSTRPRLRGAEWPLLISAADAVFLFEEISIEPLDEDMGEPIFEALAEE